MRHSKSCEVLESVNPHPVPGGYCAGGVLGQDQRAPHGIVHADAYDAQDELLKDFDPTSLEKVNGRLPTGRDGNAQRQTGSRTVDQVRPGPVALIPESESSAPREPGLLCHARVH